MNNKLLITYLILIFAPLFFGCGGPVAAENKNNVSASSTFFDQKYMVDTGESVITWKGSMVLSAEDHAGYVYISKGELLFEKGQLVGGTMEINMNTIEYGDKKNKNTPVKHLKSPDYFDVEKFPVSAFSITKVVDAGGGNIEVTGNLTIKAVTNAVTFPAKIEIKDGIANANGKIVIDRTKWGIRYSSGKFYDNLADQAVSDDIEFHMKIVAKK